MFVFFSPNATCVLWILYSVNSPLILLLSYNTDDISRAHIKLRKAHEKMIGHGLESSWKLDRAYWSESWALKLDAKRSQVAGEGFVFHSLETRRSAARSELPSLM